MPDLNKSVHRFKSARGGTIVSLLTYIYREALSLSLSLSFSILLSLSIYRRARALSLPLSLYIYTT